MPQLEFSLSNIWIALVFAALSVALAVFTYRSTAVAAPLRITFITLRSLALFLTLTLLVEPAITTVSRSVAQPQLALLLDHSESMSIKDNGVRRDSMQTELLESSQPQFSKVNVSRYRFGTSLRKSPSDLLPDSASLDKQTNFSEALLSLQKERTKEKLNAALLISDGSVTAGEAPATAAEQSQMPVYTVLVGDTTAKRDIVLRRILTNQTAIAGTKVPLSAVITQSGFQGAKVEVTLQSEGGIIAKKNLELLSPEQSVSFELEVKEPGEQKFRVSVSKAEGEFSGRNNDQSAFITVLKSKKKILVIAAFADPEIGAVRKALAQNKNLEPVFYTQRTTSEFFEGALNTEKHRDADAAILIGFPASITTDALSQSVLRFLTATKIPVLSMIGLQSSGPRLKTFEPLLALRVGRTSSGDALDNLIFAKPAPQAGSSPIFKSLDLAEAFRLAPPMSYLDFDFKPKPVSETLLTLIINGRPTEKIIFATAKLQGRRAATMCGVQFWHYALSAEDDVRRFYEQTILGSLEWLTAQEDAKRFAVQPAEKIFDAGSRIAFTATVQDETLQPVPNAAISLTVRNKTSKQSFTLAFDAASEAGLYNAVFETLPQGDYGYTAEAKTGGRSLGVVSGIFSVSETGAEFLALQADAETLREIARQSGGKFYTAKNFNQFFSDLQQDAAFQTMQTEERQSFELANVLPTLIVIVLLLSLEWLLRKLNALP
ncbi:MAG: hypothetical protein IAF08_07665 [Rhizobacter sp.]|nr:hypothetical protein [Chlorobiales bacterium]